MPALTSLYLPLVFKQLTFHLLGQFWKHAIVFPLSHISPNFPLSGGLFGFLGITLFSMMKLYLQGGLVSLLVFLLLLGVRLFLLKKLGILIMGAI